MSDAERSTASHPIIILVGGGKGAVGKSMVSMALLDYLRANGKTTFLLETDTSAPDVWKTMARRPKTSAWTSSRLNFPVAG